MRNLALQSEIRHVVPLPHPKVQCGGDFAGVANIPGNIIAVIQNTNNNDGDFHLDTQHIQHFEHDQQPRPLQDPIPPIAGSSIGTSRTSYAETTDANATATNCGNQSLSNLSDQPPVSFVVTSQGFVLALDGNDRLVWVVDLEKVVVNANEDDEDGDEEEEEEEEGVHRSEETNEDGNNMVKPRSQWFYASPFLQEESPEEDPDNPDNPDNPALGMDWNANGGLHVLHGLHGLHGLHITCLSHAGHVVSVSIEDTTSIVKNGGRVEEASECIGSFENGLECGGWSPDGEVLALVTFSTDEEEEGKGEEKEKGGSNDSSSDCKIPILMTMNTQYEILAEVKLEPCLFSPHEETQSSTASTDRGSKVGSDSLPPNAITLCWRPDSSSFAISTMDSIAMPTNTNNTAKPPTKTLNTLKTLRRIRTYHRTTLALLSLSKEEDGSGRDVPNLLPAPPTWAPGGCSHYVGAVQSLRSLTSRTNSRARQQLQVAFMEPNGLRHRECKIHNTGTLTLGKEREEVTGIAFNLEGDLLAVTVLVTSMNGDVPPYGKVQLYHRSNYYWYLKYELRYDGKSQLSQLSQWVTSAVVSKLAFSTEDPYRVMIALDRRQSIGRNVADAANAANAANSANSADSANLAAMNVLEWRDYSFRWESSTVHYCQDSRKPLAAPMSPMSTMSSSVLAMSIDGTTLNFTPLDRAIVPPPMYSSSLELPAPVVGISGRPSFHGDVCDVSMEAMEGRPENGEGRVEFIIVMSDGKWALMKWGGKDGKDGQKPNGMSLTPGFHPPEVCGIVDPWNTDWRNDSEAGNELKPSLQEMNLRDVTIIDADENSLSVVAVSSPKDTYGKHSFFDNLIEMKVSWSCRSTDDDWKPNINVISCVPVERKVLRVVNWSDSAKAAGARGSALIELVDGSLLEYSQGGAMEPSEAGPLLEPCPWVVGLYDATVERDQSSASPQNNTYHEESPKRLVFGLSSRYRLYSGERLLSSASSSFILSVEHKFLAHVTLGSRAQIRFVPLSSLLHFDPLMGSDENGALDGYEPRSIERGARLVAIFPTSPNLVVQMPRGNLESISPRALVLPYVMAKIESGDYHTAVSLMRRQRVDMNLIVDYDPNHFLQGGGAEKFIGQVEKIDYINLFLSSLIDVDTTLWKYPVPSWIRMDKDSSATTDDLSKVNQVCKKMRAVMLDAERDGVTSSGKIVKEGHFLLPVLSTFAKQSPPMLQDALSLIKDSALRRNSEHSKKKPILLSDYVQNSIQYLAFLADYEHIFDTAIGMYDFDLAKAVARHSQMDPKVYLPMLKRWRELPPSVACYEVDVKLKRYESALRHLVMSGQKQDETSPSDHFDKCLKFIEEHSLHKLGLELFSDQPNGQRAIMVSLGEQLLSDRKPKEALAIFLASNPKYIDGGKRAARACGDWRTYFVCCAEDSNASSSDISDVASEFADYISSKGGNMKEQNEAYASAARILLDYCNDVDSSMEMIISAHMWSEGRRIAHLHDRNDLAKKCVDAAVSYAKKCVEDLEERKLNYQQTNDRYSEVIIIRREALKEEEITGSNDLHHDENASLFSMQSTASNTSLRSTASGASIGSVASVSTVISVGATSTFSFTGENDAMKHKSKFNRIGREKVKKKNKKKGPAAKRMKPGSEEELKHLVDTLTYSCPDEHYVAVICSTIKFLLHSGKSSFSMMLVDSYNELQLAVEKLRDARIDRDQKERESLKKKAFKEGGVENFVQHPCEKEVNSILCKPLPDHIETVISLIR